MGKVRLFILLCGIMTYSLSWAGDTLRVSGANNIRITGFLNEFVDCSKELTAPQVLEKWRGGAFAPVEADRVINRGVTRCQHWFALTIQNTSERLEDYLWNFYYDGIKFTLYELDTTSTSIVSDKTMSHHTLLSERDVALRSISFRIPMKANESKTFLLKTEVYGRQNLYFPTDISTESDILVYELDFSLLIGRYYGFFLFAIVFNLCLFVVLRRRFYGMMLGYVVSLLAFNLVEYLHGVYLIPETIYAWWVMIPKIIFLAFTLYFNVFVFQSFTVQEKYLPQLNHVLTWCNKGVLCAALVFFVLYLFFFTSPEIVYVIQSVFAGILLTQTLVLFINIIYAAYRRTPYIFHYLIGNSLLFISVVLYILNTFDVIYFPQIFQPGNIIFAFAFESVYLMIVFVIKYKRDVDAFVSELSDAEAKRAKLTVELIATQEKERERIARDIHDGIGGTLQALRLMLSQEALHAGVAINNTLKELNADFRNLVHQITPRHLHTLGLFGTIEKEALAYRSHALISCDLEGNERLLSWDLKINLYRIYQELLTNALKHGQGLTAIDIQLLIEEDVVRLLVENDREKQELKHTGSSGHGITNVQSRIAYYDGTYEVTASMTRYIVEVTIPLEKKERKKNDPIGNH